MLCLAHASDFWFFCFVDEKVYSLFFGILMLSLKLCFPRRLRGPGVPATVLRYAPDTCNVYVVSRHRLRRKLASLSSFSGTFETIFLSINELACP